MKNLREMALNALWTDCLEVIAVNVLYGSHRFLKTTDPELAKHPQDDRNIHAILRDMADDGRVHPDDVGRFYDLLMRISRDRSVLLQGRRMSVTLRWRIGAAGYARAVLEILFPADFSAENPWAVFCVKRVGDHDAAKDESLEPFSAAFRKILKVSLEDGGYEIVRASEEDLATAPKDSARVWDWFDSFAAAGGVHPDDLEAYRAFTDSANLRLLHETGERHPSCRYRRRCGDAFRWTILELFPCPDHDAADPWVMLYVRDIEDHYAEDMERLEALESIHRRDPLTGLKGRQAFTMECGILRQDPKLFRMGMVFARLPGGRDAVPDASAAALGDSLADIFRRESCFRIDPDLFAVLLPGIPETVMGRRMESCRDRLESRKLGGVLLGSAWSDSPVSVDDLETRAFAEMGEKPSSPAGSDA